MGVFTEGHALLVDTLLIGGLFLLLWYLYKLLLAPLFSPLRKVNLQMTDLKVHCMYLYNIKYCHIELYRSLIYSILCCRLTFTYIYKYSSLLHVKSFIVHVYICTNAVHFCFCDTI